MSTDRSDQIEEVFKHWCDVSGRPIAYLHASRIAIISNALDAYSVEQLKDVATWASRDPFFSGRDEASNKRYDIPEVIFNSCERIDEILKTIREETRKGNEQTI